MTVGLGVTGPVTVNGARSEALASPPHAVGRPHSASGWVFAAPATVLLSLFFFYPLAASLWTSLHATTGGTQTWVGFDQYHRLFQDPLVLKSLSNGLLLLVVQVPLMISLALMLAYVLDGAWVRWRKTFRAVFFLPAITTLVAYSIVFRVLLTTDGGLVNQMLGLLGFAPVDWLNTEHWSRVAVVASVTWRWTGYNMVILLAGLQAIPRDLYEAAMMDGAGSVATFRYVVLPMLSPVLLFTIVTSSIGALQLFDENFILTGGGPDNATLTPVLYLYKVGFRQFDFGFASAIAWMLVVLIALLSLAQFRFIGRRP